MSLLSRVAKFAKSTKFVNKNKQIYLFIFTEVYEGMRRNPAQIKAFRVESLYFKVEPAVGVEPTT